MCGESAFTIPCNPLNTWCSELSSNSMLVCCRWGRSLCIHLLLDFCRLQNIWVGGVVMDMSSLNRPPWHCGSVEPARASRSGPRGVCSRTRESWCYCCCVFVVVLLFAFTIFWWIIALLGPLSDTDDFHILIFSLFFFRAGAAHTSTITIKRHIMADLENLRRI